MRVYLHRHFLLLICCFFYCQASVAASTGLLTAQGYDSHVELNWHELYEAGTSYSLMLSVDEGQWHQRQVVAGPSLIDFTGDLGRGLSLRYKLFNSDGTTELAQASSSTENFSDEQLLEMVQRYTFRYFWDFADPDSGWAKERFSHVQDSNIITTGGTGFGIAAIITATERGWISREQGVKRLLKITQTLSELERFHGMWAHWYSADSRQVVDFSQYDDGGDVVESAFMAQGLLTARQYFDGNDEDENQLRANITGLWQSMEWDWYTRGEDVIYWHWSKNYGWKMDHPIKGYNEALIVYVLAAASQHHSIAATVYHQGWASQNNPSFRNDQDYYGLTLPLGNKDHKGGPLFFAHYSFMGLDPRGLQDKYANYWQQNVQHTLINRAYCVENPYDWQGYGADFWGLTAGDKVPTGYTAHAPGLLRDPGTITPSAALSSMPYTPQESLQVLKNLYYTHGKSLFGQMGFYDGINLSLSAQPDEQVRKTYLAIDQGPIVAMIENYRSQLLWRYFMQDTDVRQGLNKLGFRINGEVID